MNGGFILCGVESVVLELVECDTILVQYLTVKEVYCLTRIPR